MRSELATLQAGTDLHERVRLAPGEAGCIAYTLAVGTSEQADDVEVTCVCGDVRVTLSPTTLARWCDPEEVGVYAQMAIGDEQPLQIILEKDFICQDRSDAENQDAFQHPHASTTC